MCVYVCARCVCAHDGGGGGGGERCAVRVSLHLVC